MAFLPIKTFEGFAEAISEDNNQTQQAFNEASAVLKTVGINFSGTVTTKPQGKIMLTSRNSFIDGRTFVNQERHHLLKRQLHRRKNIAKAVTNIKKRQETIKRSPGQIEHLQASLDLLMEFGVSMRGMGGQSLVQSESEAEDKDLNLIAGTELFDLEHKLIAANRPLIEIPVNLKNYSRNSLDQRDLNAAEFYASEYGYLFNVLDPGTLSLYSTAGTKFSTADRSRGAGTMVSANVLVSAVAMYSKIDNVPSHKSAPFRSYRPSDMVLSTTKRKPKMNLKSNIVSANPTISTLGSSGPGKGGAY